MTPKDREKELEDKYHADPGTWTEQDAVEYIALEVELEEE